MSFEGSLTMEVRTQRPHVALENQTVPFWSVLRERVNPIVAPYRT